MLDKKNVLKEFLSFVSQFSESDMRVRYKKGHTFRVAENCRFIAEGIGLNLDNIDLAWLCGMLHDIGRFKQVEERETFRDSKDFTHAEYGCKILFEEGLISRFCDEKDWYDILYKAIYNHSFLALPEGLTRREELFCNIVRDADKIDIIRGALFYDFKMFHEYTEEEIQDSDITDSAVQYFYRHTLIPFADMKTPADYFLRIYAFYFDLHYPCSYELVDKQGEFDKMLLYQFRKEQNQRQFAIIKKCLMDYKRSILLS